MLEPLIQEIREEFPTFRIVHKSGDSLSRAIDVALRVLTLGRMREYVSHYHTVIGTTLYVPEGWDETPDLERVITLRHERVHLRQRRRWGLPLMTFLYLIPYFPLGLAYGRARIEWEAYTETLRATAELKGLDAARSPQLRREILRRFTSADYGWMWPFESQVGHWYDRAIEDIEHSMTSNDSGGSIAIESSA
ncbi:MAG: hypothetical protein KC776_37715 [Myxococcales bacterium]|nr:hypothetical protein [Myxococcales bacterium]MCB9577206.1 hypothetical protein [Polyangiaceae bacterium]